MLRETLLVVKYPYAAGVNFVIWISTALLFLINNELPIINMITLNMLATLIISFMGFRVSGK